MRQSKRSQKRVARDAKQARAKQRADSVAVVLHLTDLIEELRPYEWGGDVPEHLKHCPICSGRQWETGKPAVHDDGCPLAALLAAALESSR